MEDPLGMLIGRNGQIADDFTIPENVCFTRR